MSREAHLGNKAIKQESHSALRLSVTRAQQATRPAMAQPVISASSFQGVFTRLVLPQPPLRFSNVTHSRASVWPEVLLPAEPFNTNKPLSTIPAKAQVHREVTDTAG